MIAHDYAGAKTAEIGAVVVGQGMIVRGIARMGTRNAKVNAANSREGLRHSALLSDRGSNCRSEFRA